MEQEVYFQSGSNSIAGTIAVPDAGNSFPAVLFIPGSGQVDRNENHKKLRLNVFKDLADFLVANGIASLRYDKRGVGGSGGNYWETGFYDNISDASAALAYLKKQQDINPKKVFLVGHSEGAYISTRMAAGGADIAGAVLLAGGARLAEETLIWQALKVTEGMQGFNKWLINLLHLDVAKAQRKQLSKIKKSKKDYYRVQLVTRLNAKWMREFIAYNPGEDMPEIKAPVLAITGSKDIQVNPEDLKLMADLIKSPFEYHALPDVSHLLRTEKGAASISNYKTMINQPLDERIPRIILDWLKRQIGV